MSKHKTSPIPETFQGWKVARRKGNRYRMFNTVSGKMGPWLRITPPGDNWIDAYTESASDLTVPELKARAERFGLKVPSKMRKGELLDILAVRSYYRSFQVTL